MAIFSGVLLYMNHLRLKLLEKPILTMFLPSFPCFLHCFLNLKLKEIAADL